MRHGTPGFVGERLREAREARGITAAALADQLGVSRQAISQYENGGVSPHPEVMRQIAEALSLPVRYFCRPPLPPLTAPVNFRSLSRATVAARKRSESRFRWLLEISDWLSRYVEIPPVNLPDWGMPSDPSVVGLESVEAIAERCRETWNLGDGPLGNVVRLMERNGVVVARAAVAEDIDAFSTWVGGRPYVFLGSDKESATRGRFNAAHELGHLLLHRNVDQAAANRHEIHAVMEDQANRFASAFLLPAKPFARDVRGATMPYFQALKPKWLASIAAMIHRAAGLGLITEDQATRLWKQRARLGWIKSEPWDDELPVEEPYLLRRSLELLLTEDVVARDDITLEVALGTTDIEELTGVAVGFLSESYRRPRVTEREQASGPTRRFSRHLTRIK